MLFDKPMKVATALQCMSLHLIEFWRCTLTRNSCSLPIQCMWLLHCFSCCYNDSLILEASINQKCSSKIQCTWLLDCISWCYCFLSFESIHQSEMLSTPMWLLQCLGRVLLFSLHFRKVILGWPSFI